MELRSAPRYLIWRRRGNEAMSVSPAEPAASTTKSVASDTLLSSVLADAISLSASEFTKQELQTLFDRIKDVQRLFTVERDRFLAPEDVLTELDAALSNASNALKMIASAEDIGSAKLRLDWTVARLGRAKKRMRRRTGAL